jgi:hypothetical protein
MERLPLTREQFAHLWATAKNIQDVSRQAGIPAKRCTQYALECGLPRRGRPAPQSVDVPLLFDLWNRNVEVRVIAERLQVREGYVSNLAKRYGLPKRDRRTLCQHTERETVAEDDPTPEEILDRAAELRARRKDQQHRQHVEIRAYHFDGRSSTFTGLDTWVA